MCFVSPFPRMLYKWNHTGYAALPCLISLTGSVAPGALHAVARVSGHSFILAEECPMVWVDMVCVCLHLLKDISIPPAWVPRQ